MIAREGSIVDASFVDAPRQRNTREQNAQIKAGERPEGFEADTAKGRCKKFCKVIFYLMKFIYTDSHYTRKKSSCKHVIISKL